MNIKQAKEEIKNTLHAYLMKKEDGSYQIPIVHQRPILLMGPPGIGKTAIMEQIAQEFKICLCAYTITHHTRQSAIGLPYIVKKHYDGKEYSITEYTMSEIVASIYQKIEETGVKEGILFLDEINCISETLAPAMLQLLQNKMFGSHKIPDGFLIVAAGNPPEYNKSVKEFDLVTLDRVKRIDLSEDYTVWKEYACQAGIHGAILSYLDIKKDHFYDISTTIQGKLFVTARGWEDLSHLLFAYETLNIKINQDSIQQYLQHPKIARDFSNYLELYHKYQEDYHIEEILNGSWTKEQITRLRSASFDEMISVMGLLNARLNEAFQRAYELDSYIANLHRQLTDWKKQLLEDVVFSTAALEKMIAEQEKNLEKQAQAKLLTPSEKEIERMILKTLNHCLLAVGKNPPSDTQSLFHMVKSVFQKEAEKRKTYFSQVSRALDHVFSFLESVFGASQEMVIFITELSMNYNAAWFIKENGCDKYFYYNKELLFQEKEAEIRKEIRELKNDKEL